MSALADILNSTPDEVKSMRILPPGTYEFVVKGYRTDEYQGKDGPVPKVGFSVRAVDVIESDEVTVEDLEQCESTSLEFNMTEKAMATRAAHISVKQFAVEVLELDSDIPWSTIFEMAINGRFRAKVEHVLVGKDKNITKVDFKRIWSA